MCEPSVSQGAFRRLRELDEVVRSGVSRLFTTVQEEAWVPEARLEQAPSHPRHRRPQDERYRAAPWAAAAASNTRVAGVAASSAALPPSAPKKQVIVCPPLMQETYMNVLGGNFVISRLLKLLRETLFLPSLAATSCWRKYGRNPRNSLFVVQCGLLAGIASQIVDRGPSVEVNLFGGFFAGALGGAVLDATEEDSGAFGFVEDMDTPSLSVFLQRALAAYAAPEVVFESRTALIDVLKPSAIANVVVATCDAMGLPPSRWPIAELAKSCCQYAQLSTATLLPNDAGNTWTPLPASCDANRRSIAPPHVLKAITSGNLLGCAQMVEVFKVFFPGLKSAAAEYDAGHVARESPLSRNALLLRFTPVCFVVLCLQV
jgi:hypothetical protein